MTAPCATVTTATARASRGRYEVGKAIDFTDPVTSERKDRRRTVLHYQVRKGDMPPEGSRVKTDELWDLVNYVRSLAKTASDDKAEQ